MPERGTPRGRFAEQEHEAGLSERFHGLVEGRSRDELLQALPHGAQYSTEEDRPKLLFTELDHPASVFASRVRRHERARWWLLSTTISPAFLRALPTGLPFRGPEVADSVGGFP